MNIFQNINDVRESGRKALAVLLDPDNLTDEIKLAHILKLVNECRVDFLLVGGSLIVEDNFEKCLKQIKAACKVPVILFPGSVGQVSGEADAMFFLSLISGRNPELLIGQHVLAAPKIKRINLETIPTGYMLVDCGRPTTASYISNTTPLPYNKPEIAAATAMAGEMLGLKCIYMDGGSGADKPISSEMIAAVNKAVDVPIIVGGGIRSESEAREIWNAGADIIVIGTAFEENPELLIDIASVKS